MYLFRSITWQQIMILWTDISKRRIYKIYWSYYRFQGADISNDDTAHFGNMMIFDLNKELFDLIWRNITEIHEGRDAKKWMLDKLLRRQTLRKCLIVLNFDKMWQSLYLNILHILPWRKWSEPETNNITA